MLPWVYGLPNVINIYCALKIGVVHIKPSQDWLASPFDFLVSAKNIIYLGALPSITMGNNNIPTACKTVVSLFMLTFAPFACFFAQMLQYNSGLAHSIFYKLAMSLADCKFRRLAFFASSSGIFCFLGKCFIADADLLVFVSLTWQA